MLRELVDVSTLSVRLHASRPSYGTRAGNWLIGCAFEAFLVGRLLTRMCWHDGSLTVIAQRTWSRWLSDWRSMVVLLRMRLTEARRRVSAARTIEGRSHASAVRTHHPWWRHALHVSRNSEPIRTSHRRSLMVEHGHRPTLTHVGVHHGTMRTLEALKAHRCHSTERARMLGMWHTRRGLHVLLMER